MLKPTFLQVVITAMMALLCVDVALAFDVSQYAIQSKLATGKWVKISIPENGVYEITYDELRAMGFSDPDRVRIYGNGGYGINEKLDGKAVDDIKPVPVLRTNGKLCFYGKGNIQFTLTGGASMPRFARALNYYSLEGCYFLTEESATEVSVPMSEPITVTSPVDNFNCLNYFYHEKELESVSRTGREMLGENMMLGKVKVDIRMPGIADSSIVVSTAVAAANSAVNSYVNATIACGGITDTVPFSTSISRIGTVGKYDYYFFATPYARLKLSRPDERARFEPFLTFSATGTPELTMARLDYLILTYSRRNVIKADENGQLLMGYGRILGNERFMLPDATSTTVVWSVSDPSNPVSMPLIRYDEHSNHGYYFSAPNELNALFVAFDPAQQLKKISSYEPIENQNLHGLQTPELLIITDKMYRDQAERVASLHRAVDGIDVEVVNQDQVFNEFSSGTRDAMGYRLFCKMLYDRDPGKFKNLLLFGNGTIDNRGILGLSRGSLLTYQTVNCNTEDFSYTSDDFFGMLADNSGTNIASDKLSIGVGRMTCTNLAEAKSNVDKLVEYYATPDYGVWRNNTLVITDDSPNKGEFMFEGEGYKNQIDNEQHTGMHVTTVHGSQYPRDSTRYEALAGAGLNRMPATEAKDFLTRCLKGGQYFGAYVGHAGSICFTKFIDMWTLGDVMSTTYKNLPILLTSCCNVAHFDHGARGIAEQMFLKRDGGAIALITSSRMVLAGDNDLLSKRLLQRLFSYHETGRMITLGEALKEAKLLYPSTNYNKMKFLLLGDPAIKFNYPVSRFNITNINGTAMTDSTVTAKIAPLQRFTIEAKVVNDEGNVDRSFNGDATVTLYDKQVLFTNMSFSSVGAYINRDIYFNRDKLGEISGRVVNGVFRGSMIVPADVKASREKVLLRVYAHRDNSSEMVNGFTKQVTMLPFDQNNAINDNEAPVINAMYINDEASFADGECVGANSMLYITASDNVAMNLQPNSIMNGLNLMLDGGKPSYNDIASYVTAGTDGKSLSVEYPLNNIAEGVHTLTFTVTDLMGLRATRTITFAVGQKGVSTMTADKLPVYGGETVNFDVESTLHGNPEYVVRVTDAVGKLVWKTTTSSFPVAWNLTDLNGNKVPAGMYRYYGTYVDGQVHGGTPIKELIVLDPVKTANR